MADYGAMLLENIRAWNAYQEELKQKEALQAQKKTFGLGKILPGLFKTMASSGDGLNLTPLTASVAGESARAMSGSDEDYAAQMLKGMDDLPVDPRLLGQKAAPFKSQLPGFLGEMQDKLAPAFSGYKPTTAPMKDFYARLKDTENYAATRDMDESGKISTKITSIDPAEREYKRAYAEYLRSNRGSKPATAIDADTKRRAIVSQFPSLAPYFNAMAVTPGLGEDKINAALKMLPPGQTFTRAERQALDDMGTLYNILGAKAVTLDQDITRGF